MQNSDESSGMPVFFKRKNLSVNKLDAIRRFHSASIAIGHRDE